MPQPVVYKQLTSRNGAVQFISGFVSDGFVLTSGQNERGAADLLKLAAQIEVQNRTGVSQKAVIVCRLRKPGEQGECPPVSAV